MSRGPLLDLFASSLVGRAAEPALEVGPPGGAIETLTFGQVEARSSRLARVLAQRGLHAGDRLAVQLANRLEFFDLFLACLRLGAIFVPVNVLYREREVGHIVGDAEPAAVRDDGRARGPDSRRDAGLGRGGALEGSPGDGGSLGAWLDRSPSG